MHHLAQKINTPYGVKSIRPEAIVAVWALCLLALIVLFVWLSDTIANRLVVILTGGTVFIGTVSALRSLGFRRTEKEAVERICQLHELALRCAGEGILVLDMEGQHTIVNPAAARMLGYTVEELVGRPSHALWHHTYPDGTPYPIEQCPIYAACKDGREHYSDREFFWRKDGTSFAVEYASTPIEQNGAFVGSVVTFRDITERKAIEARYMESEERYHDLFENAGDLIQIFNSQGQIEYANRMWRDTLGYEADEVLGLPLTRIIHPDCIDHCMETFQRIVHGESVGLVRTRFVKKNGEGVDVEGHITSNIKSGQFIHTRGIFRDVTEQRRLEREVLEALARSKQLEGIQQVAVTLQHEINNPLSAIMGTAQLINLKLPAVASLPSSEQFAELKSSVTHIVSLSQRIAEVVKKLRNLYDPVVTYHPVDYCGDAPMIDLKDSR